MPPALVAELEDVAQQLAQLCGELGVDGPLGDGDCVHGDLDTDGESEEDNVSEIDDDCESLASSLEAATSECEALMVLLNDDCQQKICRSICSPEKQDEDSAREARSDVQSSVEALDSQAECGQQNPHWDTEEVEWSNDSDESEGGYHGELLDEFDGFAGELEALSSQLAGFDYDNPRSFRDDCDDCEEDTRGLGGESEHTDTACSKARETQPTSKITTIPRHSSGSAPKSGSSAPRQAHGVLLQQGKVPSQSKHRIRRLSVGLRPRKWASVREKASKRAASAVISGTDKAYWNEFQRKSFARHISRQQFARLRVMEEQAAEKRLVAMRFQHSSTLSGSQSNLQPAKGIKGDKVASTLKPSSTVEDRSYLDRFARRHELKCDEDTASKDAMTRVLCGVYTYGRRQDGVVYMTFTCMAQLRERVASRLGVNPIVNLYRERGMSTVGKVSIRDQRKPHHSRTLQRVSSFTQVADGDMLCVTRDAYEDMAILCEWMTQRRQPPSRAGAEHSTEFMRSPTTGAHGDAGSERVPSNAVPALRHMAEGDAARSNRAKSGSAPLWDCNGRNIRVGDTSYRVFSKQNPSGKGKQSRK